MEVFSKKYCRIFIMLMFILIFFCINMYPLDRKKDRIPILIMEGYDGNVYDAIRDDTIFVANDAQFNILLGVKQDSKYESLTYQNFKTVKAGNVLDSLDNLYQRLDSGYYFQCSVEHIYAFTQFYWAVSKDTLLLLQVFPKYDIFKDTLYFGGTFQSSFLYEKFSNLDSCGFIARKQHIDSIILNEIIYWNRNSFYKALENLKKDKKE